MKNPLTASERRGILVVAAISLLITGCGWGVAMCGRSEAEEMTPEVEVLLHGDSLTSKGTTDKKSSTERGKKKGRRDSVSSSVKKKDKKVYRKRSPLDEPV
ncbi:MAG: hypothetical protein HDR88_16835 [Bacteroides sp.]|nr:hypothetical protein [Bacteroides sp.]